jgi:glutaredoxin-like protein DUF836
MPAEAPRITLLSRGGCHLCDDARAVVAAIAADTGVLWDERDIDAADADPQLAEEYGDRVPVVLVDGREHAYWRVEETRLRAAIAGQRRW